MSRRLSTQYSHPLTKYQGNSNEGEVPKISINMNICEAYVDEYSEPSPLTQDCIHV